MIQKANVSLEQFLEALEAGSRDKADDTIAGLRAGYGKDGITAENVKRALQSKNNTAYFQLCADLLYAYERYEKTFSYYLWHSNNLERVLDCAEKLTLDTVNLSRISMRLARKSPLADPEKLEYSYMESDYDENPYDPTHWEVHVTNYKHAFEIVKSEAKEGDELCLRFLALIPADFESHIVNRETNCY